MSTFYPVINVEAENEHFQICDSLISWIELQKSLETDCKDDPQDATTRSLSDFIPSTTNEHQLMAFGVAWSLVRLFNARVGNSSEKLMFHEEHEEQPKTSFGSVISDGLMPKCYQKIDQSSLSDILSDRDLVIRIRGNDEWAPPRPQIIFNIPEETNFRKLMQRQNYRCAGCGTKIDLELARRLVLYCNYLGKYFCKCCFSYKAIHLPGYILKKWDFHKYPVSHFALQLLDRLANEPLFNINDINPPLYKKVKKLRQLLDVRMQLYYLKIYVSTCTLTEKLYAEYTSFAHQHLLQDEVHLYSLNNLIELQHGKLYEYLHDLVVRSVAHIADCDRCRAKGHYCQLCGPSSLMNSIIQSASKADEGGDLIIGESTQEKSTVIRHKDLKEPISGTSALSSIPSSNSPLPTVTSDIKIAPDQANQSCNASSITQAQYTSALISVSASINIDDPELIFPFEIGRVAQCAGCGCCFHLKCFLDADKKCPKCERMQRRKAQRSTSNAPETCHLKSIEGN